MGAAGRHVGAKSVLAIDLKDFFGQISYERVSSSLFESRFDSEVCAWIEGTCFVDGVLPFGFRTSPTISNQAFHTMDGIIEGLASRHGVVYTRWVDDLTFSGAGVGDELLSDITGALEENGWAVNERKTRFMRRSPYVLGLYVGPDVDQPRLPRRLDTAYCWKATITRNVGGAFRAGGSHGAESTVWSCNLRGNG